MGLCVIAEVTQAAQPAGPRGWRCRRGRHGFKRGRYRRCKARRRGHGRVGEHESGNAVEGREECETKGGGFDESNRFLWSNERAEGTPGSTVPTR